jgi:hypothetical protein
LNDGHPCRQDSGGCGEQWQRAEVTGDNGKQAGKKRESNELTRQCQWERSADCKHVHVPSQR